MQEISNTATIQSKNYKQHFQKTTQLALPVVVGQLGQIMMGVLDTAMIGVLGYVPVSAAGLANGLFILLVVVGLGMMSAVSPLVAQAQAKGEKEDCRHYLQQSTYIAIVFGIVLGVIFYFAAPLIRQLNQPEADVVLAIDYLRILATSILPMVVFLAFKQFADGLSDTRPAMYITFLGLGCNFILNYLFIEGHWGFPRWELNGAGVATVISRYVMMVLMMLWVFKSKKYALYALAQGWYQYAAKYSKEILKIGVPSGLQYFFELGAFSGVSVMIGWLGSEHRSAHQIAISLVSVTYMVASGISAAASIQVADALGREDKTDVKRAGFTGMGLVLVWMSVCAIFFILGKDVLPTLYNLEDTVVLTIASKLLIMGALFQLFDGMQVLGLGILRGIQDVTFPTIVTFFAYWAICLPLSYVLGFTYNYGVEGCWFAFVIALAFASVCHTLRFWYLTKA